MVVLGAFERDSGLIYSSDILGLTTEKIIRDIKKIASDSLNLALNINYPTQQTMVLVIPTAVLHARNLVLNANIVMPDSVLPILQKAYTHANLLNSKIPQQTQEQTEKSAVSESGEDVKGGV